MKNNHVFTAIALITIGVLCLLRAFGIIAFSWWALFRLWPLLLIWIGVKFIPMNDGLKLVFKILILIFGIFLLFYYSNSSRCCCHNWWAHKNFDCEKTFVVKTVDGETFEYDEYFTKTKNDEENILPDGAKLNLSVSAGKLTFTPGESLFAIEKNESARYFTAKINKRTSGDNAQITAELSPKKDFALSNKLYYNVLLSDVPVWEMALDLNATASDIDLSTFKVRELKVEANASAVDLKLGNLYEEVNVEIESNASAIKLMLPKDMKFTVSKDNTLSSMNISGFKKQSDGSYISEKGIETVGTIHITVDANVSSVEVRRY